MSAFDDAFVAVIGVEKGYVNDPHDPGGQTMFGITARVARANGYTGPMRDLPLATAKDIAKRCYWDQYQCDLFDPRIGYLMFDIAYNGGYATKWLQIAAGAKPDGKLGPNTIAKVKATDPLRILMRMLSLRISYYTSLRGWKYYGKGWSNRVAINLMRCAI